MDVRPQRDALRTQSLSDQPGNRIFRQYYTENDFVLSPEGILKAISALVCVIASGLYLGSGSCVSQVSLVLSATTVALACSAVNALLYAGTVLELPLYAPQAWLFADIILSTVMGVLLLIVAVLAMTVCEMNNVISYVHGPLGIVNASIVTASAVMTYVSVMRVWDASRMPYEPPRPTPEEQDV